MWMVLLDRTEARTGCWRRDVVGKGNAALDAPFAPGFLLATEIALDPGDGDAGPDGGPCEREGPAQLAIVNREAEERGGGGDRWESLQ